MLNELFARHPELKAHYRRIQCANAIEQVEVLLVAGAAGAACQSWLVAALVAIGLMAVGAVLLPARILFSAAMALGWALAWAVGAGAVAVQGLALPFSVGIAVGVATFLAVLPISFGLHFAFKGWSTAIALFSRQT